MVKKSSIFGAARWNHQFVRVGGMHVPIELSTVNRLKDCIAFGPPAEDIFLKQNNLWLMLQTGIRKTLRANTSWITNALIAIFAGRPHQTILSGTTTAVTPLSSNSRKILRKRPVARKPKKAARLRLSGIMGRSIAG